MSGRTDIWAAVLRAAPDPFIGAGFESFWISPNVRGFQQQLLALGWYPILVDGLNEAHNGYIEIYLNLGAIGVLLIATILIAGYRSSFKAFQQDPELGGFVLVFITIAMVYSITEAGFRMLNLAWIFLLLATVSASGVTTGLFGGRRTSIVPSSRVGSRRAVSVGRAPRSALRTTEG
jgi:O-antigen ligase